MVATVLAALTAATAQQQAVRVPVATLWVSPAKAVALGPPTGWARFTAARRLALVGRIETQALLGEPVRVIARRGAWLRVVLPSQPSPRDARGYPGWVRASAVAPAPRGATQVRVTARTATLTTRAGALALSYGTRLPLVRTAGAATTVAVPGGGTGTIASSSLRTTPLPATRAAIVADARRFERVRYLWGGTSAYGWDCSGLLHRVFGTHGVTIPRDADAQAAAGAPVARADLRPGDLVFFGVAHVHHVALFVGDDKMLEAPNSSAAVRVVPLRSADYAGARRYLP
jgi:cell wall-associated NlpC family hydrolase